MNFVYVYTSHRALVFIATESVGESADWRTESLILVYLLYQTRTYFQNKVR